MAIHIPHTYIYVLVDRYCFFLERERERHIYIYIYVERERERDRVREQQFKAAASNKSSMIKRAAGRSKRGV